MVRVRFAPSPTGFLHVGGVRTALFNWYYARRNNGVFILRIEDTDIERSKKEYEDIIIKDMNWCGLNYDEGPDKPGQFGPYRQSERNEIYKEYINLLIKEKKAYYAVYSKENEEEVIFKSYDFPSEYSSEGYSVTVKFEVPKNRKIAFDDMVKGNIEFDTQVFDDFVIMRSNGAPMYNFTVVIDDMLMKVTHVFRGEDHISNTPKQIMLYEAFNAQPPRFAHIPLILGEDKTPLSKRHGGTSVEFFKEEGYLPEALMNYLGVLGWTAEEQIFNIQDKVEQFSMEMVSNKSVVFDYKKLMWINGEHMRSMDIDTLYSHFEDWLKTCNIHLSFDKEYIKSVLDISRVKVSTLKQLYEFSYGFFTDTLEYCQEFGELKAKEWFAPVISETIRELENAVYTVDGISQALSTVAEKKFTNKKNTFQAIRGALMGRLITPGLYESITVLGKEKVLKRLHNVL